MSPSDDKSLDTSIAFARHAFDNYQTLIRFSDTKAGLMVTVMVFLAASALQISKDAIGKLHIASCVILMTSIVFVAASFGLLISVVLILITLHRVIRPRGARYYGSPQKGRDLLWQDHIMQYGTNAEYFSAVREASPELILQNLTDQVFELAHISKEKMDALTSSRWIIWLGFWSWVVCILCGQSLMRLS
jgi:hypothetical protein